MLELDIIHFGQYIIRNGGYITEWDCSKSPKIIWGRWQKLRIKFVFDEERQVTQMYMYWNANYVSAKEVHWKADMPSDWQLFGDILRQARECGRRGQHRTQKQVKELK